jgi:hypothetical protein
MEYSDNLTASDVLGSKGAALDTAGTAAKKLLGNIRNKAKAKKAQKISDAGGYATLSAFQKSLIPVPAYINQQAQTVAASSKTPAAAVIDKMKTSEPIPVSDAQKANLFKQYLPYLIVVIVIGALLYFFVIKK